MSFGQDFLKGFFGTDYLKDYTHASKTFRSAGYELAPRQKFLYHVYFTLNPNIPELQKAFQRGDKSSLSLLVKNVQLPSFDMETEVLNQYNRKRIIQKKINYKPVRLVMHDDGSDLARRLWYNYYSYYYKDPSQAYGGSNSQTVSGFNYNDRDIYTPDKKANDWGFAGEGFNQPNVNKPAFFKDITIYGFNQKKFASYILINPIITNFDHDSYDYSQGNGIMENTMTLAYETVKYMSGPIGSQVPGFAEPGMYDTSTSPLARPGATNSLTGPGGILATGAGLMTDLEGAMAGNPLAILGAVQKAGALANQTKNIKQIAKAEVSAAVSKVLSSDALTSTIRSGISTPVPSSGGSNATVGSPIKYN